VRPLFAAIAAFSSGVTHTLIGVDSLRVFPFLASIAAAAATSVSKDKVVERRQVRLFGELLLFVYHCFDRIVINGYLSGCARRAPAESISFSRVWNKGPPSE
jgi:hypothetical protein